jgi:hypothetical protein
VLANPGARGGCRHDLAGSAARRAEINILERRRIAELRLSQPLRQAALLTRGPFRLDEQAEAIVKGDPFPTTSRADCTRSAAD